MKLKGKKISFKIDFKKNKKRIIALGVCLVLLLINFGLGFLSNILIRRMPDQLTAERWEADINMAQASVFVTEDKSISEKDIPKIKYNLEKKLVESGVEAPEEDNDKKKTGSEIIDTIGIDEMNADSEDDDDSEMGFVPETGLKKLYRIVYSAEGTVDLTCDQRTVEGATAIGVGGDFFLFHPLELVAGGYLMDDPLMKDGIVLDEDTAWQLFGSSDVINMQVMIGDVPHYVKGVVKKPQGKVEKLAGLNKSYVFMSYDSLSKYGDILSGKTSEVDDSEDGTTSLSGGINCIEVVCPNPVKGLAAKILFESSGISEENCEVIDNTERFTFLPLLQIVRKAGFRSMWSKAIYYPYWENVARGYEDRLALILSFRIFCIALVVIIAVIMIIIAYRNKKWTIESVALYLADKKYDLEVKRKQKKDNDIFEKLEKNDIES